MSNPPLCAVWVVTFNHKRFIAQTIESIVHQKTEFPFKVFIGDDCSTDGTREICLQYKEAYPDLIELVFNSVNHMQQNSANVYKACFSSGARYTAMCEGDDYWNDPYKLQKQIGFLETHETYVGCFHNTEERYQDDDTKASWLYCGYPGGRDISFDDMTHTNVIPTCSVVYRNNLFGDFPTWYPKLLIGDWPLHLLNAQYGNFRYIPQVMSVHRLHSKGVWGLQDPERNTKHIIDTYNVMIDGFSYNQALADKLIAAKAAFILAHSAVKKRPSYRQRAKHLLIRIIENV